MVTTPTLFNILNEKIIYAYGTYSFYDYVILRLYSVIFLLNQSDYFSTEKYPPDAFDYLSSWKKSYFISVKWNGSKINVVLKFFS